MNILLVEDKGSVSYYLNEELSKKHNVSHAKNVYKAKEHVKDNDNKFDLIIADLNMSPNGLTDNEIDETQGGMLTGWIWLKNYVFKDNPDMKKKTIIFSDYTDELEAELEIKASKQELEGISHVKKSDPSEVIGQLMDIIREYEESDKK